MKTIWILLVLLLAPMSARAAEVESKFADVGPLHMHYLIAGKGDVVVLLHGFGESSRMWVPLMKALSDKHTVIAPDLRGAGQTEVPVDGYTKAIMARDVHNLVESLGFKNVQVVGHDVGMMVAYAYASMYPTDVKRVVLMDAFLPGIGDWKSLSARHALWHLSFYGDTPEALVKGRERIYLDHFWNDFAVDPKHSVPEADRVFYTKEYAQPQHIHAGMEWFKAFDQDAQDFADDKQYPLEMPVLSLAGEKSMGPFLAYQVKMIATHAQSDVIQNAGHWLMEEAPDQVIPKITAFLNQPVN